jgi:hypothetical protein
MHKGTPLKETQLLMGARILEGDEAAQVDLGPLADLVGTWTSKEPETPGQLPLGWNIIAVPGSMSSPAHNGDFILEVIPYVETLTFSPVVAAGNRGPVKGTKQLEQQITGLVYKQIITSVCNTPRCVDMGFSAGNEIHAETGLLLYIKDCITNGGLVNCENAEYSIARLATIPHGNALLALGTSSDGITPGNIFGAAPTKPRPVNSSDIFTLAYTDQYTRAEQFPGFSIEFQSDPNKFLNSTLSSQEITKMTRLNMSTTLQTGGVLNIPFGVTEVKTLDVDASFVIEKIAGQDALQLQYSQTINLIFPGLGARGPIPVIWPHVTINTCPVKCRASFFITYRLCRPCFFVFQERPGKPSR